jgi:uncharacterized protein YlzI (FlbEa/FlbD family)
MGLVKVTQIVDETKKEPRLELPNWVNMDNVERIIAAPDKGPAFYFVSGFYFEVKETLDEILKQIPE